MNDIHIHAEQVIVQQDPEWIEAAAVEIKRTGDTLEVSIALADGRKIPLEKRALKDGAAVSMPFTPGVVRVQKDVQGGEEPKA